MLLGFLLVPSQAPRRFEPPRHTETPLPMRDGVSPSCVVLPAHHAAPLLDRLAAHLPVVGRDEWLARMLAGDVVDAQGQPAPRAGGQRQRAPVLLPPSAERA